MLIHLQGLTVSNSIYQKAQHIRDLTNIEIYFSLLEKEV